MIGTSDIPELKDCIHLVLIGRRLLLPKFFIDHLSFPIFTKPTKSIAPVDYDGQ